MTISTVGGVLLGYVIVHSLLVAFVDVLTKVYGSFKHTGVSIFSKSAVTDEVRQGSIGAVMITSWQDVA